MKSSCWIVGFLCLLAACETSVPPKQFAELRYTHLPKIPLAVSRVVVVEYYQSSKEKPYVEAEFPLLPARAAIQWLKDRLSPVGGPGFARATVMNGSVVETSLQRSRGIRGAFTKDQSERYDGTLLVKIEILDDFGGQQGFVSSEVKRSTTVSEDVSLADREQTWFRMTEEMIKDLDSSLEEQVRKHFKNWLR